MGMLLTIPLFLSSNMLFSYTVSPAFGTLIHITLLLAVGLFAIQVPFYLFRCIVLLKNEVGLIKHVFAHLSRPSLCILRILIVLLISTWSLNVLRTLNIWLGDPNHLLGGG